MAKTFDNISEASATNYLFIFSQRTLALRNELPTPPPLNALGLPCEVICLLGGLLPKKDKAGNTQKDKTPPTDDMASEAAVAAFDFGKKIAPLAKLITEYILDHQDDAAQEDRWRTTMKRDMGKSFRVQREEVQTVKAEVKAEVQKIEAEVQKVEAELQRQRVAIHEVHSKLDETIQLVRNLANPGR